MRAEIGWAALIGGVVAYDILNDETLSEGADRALEAHPWLTCSAVGAVALHLVNAIPERFDPIHLLFKVIKRGPLDCDI